MKERSDMEKTNRFGAWVREQRKLRGLTVEELAKRVGCSIGGVRNVERGQRMASPRLAAALTAHVAWHDDDAADTCRQLWLMDIGARAWAEFDRSVLMVIEAKGWT